MADYYSDNANALFKRYTALDFEAVHANLLPCMPDTPGAALDIGAGAGRDALALAKRGWEVVAVEPAQRLRQLGASYTEGQAVQWMDDRLPALEKVRALSERFDLILVSAVWMHVPGTQRERAMRVLGDLLAPGGRICITLRYGPGDGERDFHPVSRGEIEHLARQRALVDITPTKARGARADCQGRSDVAWETVCLRLPDDGTGALPVLRHIIVNDQKSSTYKLGLLRAITRIADGLPGMVLKRTEDYVTVPFGLVGLYWIRLYKPLIQEKKLPQIQGNVGYGFAKAAFWGLHSLSALDLRVGQAFDGATGRTVLEAIRDACHTVRKMPANYTTWPGSIEPIFIAEPSSLRLRQQPVRLDLETLSRFGVFHIPRSIWDCASRYACWLEPAIVNEWFDLMGRYEMRYRSEPTREALRWREPIRQTDAVRALIESRLAERPRPRCAWTATPLQSDRYEVDHCLPWTHWSNNDLWNLLPATRRANREKRDRLPAARLLDDARDRILEWWETSYLQTGRRAQFMIEAEAALPMVEDASRPEAVFEGLQHQRRRLKQNQQIAEWMGLS
ncbi:methyltransferase domain-containing protein [Spiribacter pallidus]|uniref:methyltransferase domain-containing protein n=1 Tax=Spiribacter pallidus TaxID=1987936 RepID=UPI0034A08883